MTMELKLDKEEARTCGKRRRRKLVGSMEGASLRVEGLLELVPRGMSWKEEKRQSEGGALEIVER